MRRFTLIIFIISFACPNMVKAQNDGINDLFIKFAKFYTMGDLFSSENCLLGVLESKDHISDSYLSAAYTNLGIVNSLLGKYEKALNYYDLAENLVINNQKMTKTLAAIYINKGIIYGYQRTFNVATEYLEKGIRIYLGISPLTDISVLQSLSSAYLNIGIIYYEINNYKTALEYLEKSADLKRRYNLTGIALTYLNIAKTYAKTDNILKAEEFYLKSIDCFNKEYGKDYFRMAELYFDYGIFLSSIGKNKEAYKVHQKALSICLKNYGEKHSLVSLAYKHLGEHFVNQLDYDSALSYYQKAIIAIVRNFSDPDISKNPSLDSTMLDVELLKILKKKSEVLELFAQQKKDTASSQQTMKESLETIDLALQLISKIRNDYMTEESRIYLADNEKETYIFATRISLNMYTLTGDPAYRQKMYNITKLAKASVLRNEITDNELFYSIGIPDTLQKKHKNLLMDIAAYNNLIQEEIRKTKPDKQKINFWKDALFEMKRGNEKLEDEINKQFSQYRDLLQKTEPISPEEIQSNLKKDETLIEYFLSNQYTNGRRKLYIFLVTKNRLNFLETDLDSLFIKDVETVREGTVQVQFPGDPLDNYRDYTGALFNMYSKLIKPVEKNFTGNKLIIIPDEEIAYLPFDAFLTSCPDSTQINYEGLQYLINHYTFSYGYSSSLIFNKEKNMTKREKVYAFSPDYRNKTGNSGKSPDYLRGATKEIGSIYRWFAGKEYFGERATESNFKLVIQQPAILHLSMHSMTDPDNSKYSCLLFDTGTDTVEDGKLYNYEIGLSRIKSSMVVLSACNTGTGTLSHGEGIMSLARGFILAGASSVIKTFWDVNDDASAKIISDFYYHLSKGKEKDDALRLAKIEYLKTTPPTYANPWYWAAYEVMGDKEPIAKRNNTGLFIVSFVLLILITTVLTGYFRRRRRFLARSL